MVSARVRVRDQVKVRVEVPISAWIRLQLIVETDRPAKNQICASLSKTVGCYSHVIADN